MPREVIDRREGRTLFGSDPTAYELARPGHAGRVYEVLVERCGLQPGTRVLEIGPGTGQATRHLLDLGADPLVAIEPDQALASYVEARFGSKVEVRRAPLEGAQLPAETFDLAIAASSFHWVEEDTGLEKLFAGLRSGGWLAIWWTLFGDGGEPDAFIAAAHPLLEGLRTSPTAGEEGRPPHALDTEARLAALAAAGFADVAHEVVPWQASWDTAGIRALYGTFSPIARLEPSRREAILDGIATIADRDFGGHVQRTLRTSLYTARKPS